MSNANQAVLVPFHGDVIEAVQDENGQVWVSIRRGCENLGLAVQRQLAKLKRKSWAVITEKVTTGADGKQYSMACLSLDGVPMWLATIEAGKVKEHLREKLARYQNEAAKVLRDHFFRRPSPPSGPDTAALADMIRQIVAESLRAAGGVGLPAPLLPRSTIAERCRFKGWLDTTPKVRNAIRKQANWLLELRHGETPDQLGNTCVYFGHQIACLDEAIDRTLEEYRRREKGTLLEGIR